MREKTGLITVKMKRPGKATRDLIKRGDIVKGKETEGIDRDSIITTA